MTKSRNAIHIILIAALALLGGIRPSAAAGTGEINAAVTRTLERFYQQVLGARELGARAAAVLVFPTIVKAGFGFGGEYGEGAMIMTPEALASFRRVDGWKVGVDGSVAIITIGAGGSIDTDKITSPVVGFVVDPKGLMYNLTLEGSKISRISR
jgi:lipid-binding SYLF domain-containing protein